MDNFTEQLRSILSSNEAYNFLDDGDFIAGGCCLLALALQPILGEDYKIKVIGRMVDGAVADHVVIETPAGDYIDGDGLQSLKRLAKKMKQEFFISHLTIADPDYTVLKERGTYRKWDIKSFQDFLNQKFEYFSAP